jgi:hypothetical protein
MVWNAVSWWGKMRTETTAFGFTMWRSLISALEVTFTEVSSRVAGRRRGFGDEYRMFKGLLV